MASFSSTARVPTADDLDEDLDFITTTREELLDRCEDELEDLPTPFEGNLAKPFLSTLKMKMMVKQSEYIFRLRFMCWTDMDKERGTKTIRIFQWILLSHSKYCMIIKKY